MRLRSCEAVAGDVSLLVRGTCSHSKPAHAEFTTKPTRNDKECTDRTSVECRTHIRGKGASRTRLATVTEWLQCWQAVVSCHLPVIFKPRPPLAVPAAIASSPNCPWSLCDHRPIPGVCAFPAKASHVLDSSVKACRLATVTECLQCWQAAVCSHLIPHF